MIILGKVRPLSGHLLGPHPQVLIIARYEVAPAFRGRGLGAAAARALYNRACVDDRVDNVIAHTLPGPNPSTGVLTSLGFAYVGDSPDPEVGTVWRWHKSVVR